MSNFKKVHHRLFGPGLLFGQREVGVGSVFDVFFVRDEKTRTILTDRAYWTEPQNERLEFSKKTLRTAHGQWKKLHAQPGLKHSSLPSKIRVLRETEFEEAA